MRPIVEPTRFEIRLRRQIRAMKVSMAVLSLAAISMATYAVIDASASSGPGVQGTPSTVVVDAAPPTSTTTTTSQQEATPSSTTPTAVTPTSVTAFNGSRVGAGPGLGSRYVVRHTEVEPEAKQLAADIAHALTTYDASDPEMHRVYAVIGSSDLEPLAAAIEPLNYPGLWSRGEVLYPQMGGLVDDRASVMVVTRQTVGSGSEARFSIVRTLDIRLVRGDSGWAFESLESAGGTFDDIDDLALAHDVASDPRIEMPDSARLDIRSGVVSPVLLRMMAELAEVTPYEIAVLTTGHPIHVFETDRTSHHTLGRAIDIIRIGDQLVIDDRWSRSPSHAVVEWLFEHPDVTQVGSPWDLDGPDARRSFTDLVHQDHIHLAVVEE